MTLSRRNILTAVLALVILTGAGAAVRHFLNSRLSAAEQRVAVAVSQAADVRAKNAAVLLLADSLKLETQAARSEAKRAILEAAQSRSALAQQRVRTSILVAAAPDTCKTIIQIVQADADSALAVADKYRASVDSLTRIDSLNTDVIARQQTALTESERALARLSDASTDLVKASHKPFLLRLLPKASFGGSAGVSVTTGRPDAVIGITLSWTP